MQESLLQGIFIYLFFVGTVTISFRFIQKLFKSKLISFVYILVLLSPFFLYIPVELNTYIHGNEFKDVEINTGFNNPIIYYKIFSVDDKEATLFYVEGKNGNHDTGNLYHFVKKNGQWKFNKWEGTIWTNLGGSASEFIIPPYF